MPILFLVVSLLILVVIGVWGLSYFNQWHLLGSNAQPKQIQVTIIDKQAVELIPTEQQSPEYEYWVYVQRGYFRAKQEFQVSVHYFNIMNTGDRGILTYQDQNFLHFASLDCSNPAL